MKDSKKKSTYSEQDLDNTSQQLNPNNEKYWKSRKKNKRPNDWQIQMVKTKTKK
jgi:hypothetical protein